MGDALKVKALSLLAYRHILALKVRISRRSGFIIAAQRPKVFAASRNSFRPVARVRACRRRVAHAKAARWFGYVPDIQQSTPDPTSHVWQFPRGSTAFDASVNPPLEALAPQKQSFKLCHSRPKISQNDAQATVPCKHCRGPPRAEPAGAPAGLAHSPGSQQPAQQRSFSRAAAAHGDPHRPMNPPRRWSAAPS